jgi:hypothetical protein
VQVTIGELWNDSVVRRIYAESRNKLWWEQNNHLRGDSFDKSYMKKFGYEEVGCERLYETMVFKAKKANQVCCPYVMSNAMELDCDGYVTPESATRGHMDMCKKWSVNNGK